MDYYNFNDLKNCDSYYKTRHKYAMKMVFIPPIVSFSLFLIIYIILSIFEINTNIAFATSIPFTLIIFFCLFKFYYNYYRLTPHEVLSIYATCPYTGRLMTKHEAYALQKYYQNLTPRQRFMKISSMNSFAFFGPSSLDCENHKKYAPKKSYIFDDMFFA